MTAEELVEKLLDVKRKADRRDILLSNQGQAMDGYTELATYRSYLERYEKEKQAGTTGDPD